MDCIDNSKCYIHQCYKLATGRFHVVIYNCQFPRPITLPSKLLEINLILGMRSISKIFKNLFTFKLQTQLLSTGFAYNLKQNF